MKSIHPRLGLIVTLLATWLIVPTAKLAHAEETADALGTSEERARELLQQGTEAINAGDFERAQALLSEAFQLRQSYDVAAALGQTELELGRYADAAGHLGLALRQFPPSESRKLKQMITDGYAKARQQVGTLTLVVTPGEAEVLVDGESQGLGKDLPPQLFLTVGEHELSVQLGERSARETLVAEAGGDYSLTLAVEDAAAGGTPTGGSAPQPQPEAWQGTAASPEDLPRGAERSWLPVVVGGAVTVVALGTGIALSVSAANERDEMRRLRDQHGSSGCGGNGTAPVDACDAQRDAAESADRKANFATASYALAGVGLVATVGYWLLARPGSATYAAPSRPLVDASVSSEGASLRISGTF